MEYIFFISRLLFGGFFVLSGLNHFKNINASIRYASSKGLPYPKFFVLLTGLLLLCGGLGILMGVYVKWAVICLVIFLVPVTLKMHKFWEAPDLMSKTNERVNFMKNMALLGGALMYLFVPASLWMWALMNVIG